MSLKDKLLAELPDLSIREQEFLKEHTSIRIGGPADYFLCIETEQELAKVVNILEEEKYPYFLLGKGSNLLVSDAGYHGVILQLKGNLEQISVLPKGKVEVGAGASLIKLATEVMKQGLTGLEFASGIPGTVGGGLVMNAGAYGGELSDVVESVRVLDIEKKKICVLNNKEMMFGYRDSVVKHQRLIVLSTVLKLEAGVVSEIFQKMADLSVQRKEKQPLEFPSAGSTFKRPEGYFAGKLIMDAGCRGYRVGDAQVSEKHCGFVINRGEATAKEVKQLMQDVGRKVQDRFGVVLEPEIIFLGE